MTKQITAPKVKGLIEAPKPVYTIGCDPVRKMLYKTFNLYHIIMPPKDTAWSRDVYKKIVERRLVLTN